MGERRTRRAAAAAAMPAAAVLAFGGTIAASAAPQPDYPSWDEVEQARANEASARAEVERIEGILVRLEQEAAELGRVALLRGEEYAQAKEALDAATARLERIRAQAERARERARESEQRVAALVAQLARTGGGDVSLGLLLGSPADADQLLGRLGTVARLGDASKALLDRAIYDKKTADALAVDAAAAERERRRLADEAELALAEAQAAAEAAEAAAAAHRADLDRMYAQLAVLKGTSAETERAYWEGQAPPASPGTPSAPATPANPSAPPAEPTPSPSPSSPSPIPTPTPSPSTPAPPPPAQSKVEIAIAFATAQLGEPYQFGGAGPDAWDCSGLTKASYAAAGINIGTHSASNQYSTMAAQGKLVPITQLQRGDLVFYSDGGSASATKYHVAIYLGGGLMIEAPRPGANVRIVALRYGDLVPYGARPAS